MDARLKWLLDGDVSVQYLTHLLLLDSPSEVLHQLQARIESEGWGKQFLEARNPSGHWGLWFYQKKWTCTHYSLLEMKEFGMPRHVPACREMVLRAFDECMLTNGAVNFAKSKVQSDVAVDGMILNYAAYFCPDEPRVERLAEYILHQVKADGGYSWDPESNFSDPHTTICVLEGFSEYRKAGFTKHADHIHASEEKATELLLSRLLFISEDQRFKKLSYPFRYRYDILRALEYLAMVNRAFDGRMAPALWWLEDKKTDSGLWHLENVHKGNVHFNLEEKGKPSRFISVKAMFIQKIYANSKYAEE
jgi:hypothetical protein